MNILQQWVYLLFPIKPKKSSKTKDTLICDSLNKKKTFSDIYTSSMVIDSIVIYKQLLVNIRTLTRFDNKFKVSVCPGVQT